MGEHEGVMFGWLDSDNSVSQLLLRDSHPKAGKESSISGGARQSRADPLSSQDRSEKLTFFKKKKSVPTPFSQRGRTSGHLKHWFPPGQQPTDLCLSLSLSTLRLPCPEWLGRDANLRVLCSLFTPFIPQFQSTAQTLTCPQTPRQRQVEGTCYYHLVL